MYKRQGSYTIIDEVQQTTGDEITTWGKLESDRGWINLNEINRDTTENSLNYILPYSSERLLIEDDIRNLSMEQLTLARNEIYARHGRIFQDETIRAYFESQSWYHGTIAPEDFSANLLSEIEQKNIEFIRTYELYLELEIEQKNSSIKQNDTPTAETQTSLTESEAKKLLKTLIPSAKKLESLIYGSSLPYSQSDYVVKGVTTYYAVTDPNYQSIADIKAAVESVYTKQVATEHFYKNRIDNTSNPAFIEAVSYTHLDVYKRQVFQVFGDLFVHNDAVTETQRQIVLGIRLPRVLAAILAGIALSNAGLLMQGVFQNPLVSPYTLGVSNGASFGAALAIVFSSHFAFLNLGIYLIPVFAFISSVLTMILVYGIAKIAKNSSKTLILSGVAVGYLFSALVSLIKYVSDTKELPELVFWTMGGFSGINWIAIAIMAGACLVSFIIMMYFSWDLNVMTAGEESAISLGVNYKKIRMIAFVLSTILTAVAVSFTGVIGFVGLIAPHVTRMIVGSDYRYMIPVSSLVGALLLLLSDTVGRNIIAPTQLPVGIITSVIGVPFFLYLIIRKRGR